MVVERESSIVSFYFCKYHFRRLLIFQFNFKVFQLMIFIFLIFYLNCRELFENAVFFFFFSVLLCSGILLLLSVFVLFCWLCDFIWVFADSTNGTARLKLKYTRNINLVTNGIYLDHLTWNAWHWPWQLHTQRRPPSLTRCKAYYIFAHIIAQQIL